MPHVNGKYYHSAGQGYSAEKSKMEAGAQGHQEVHDSTADEHEGQGPIVHVKHLGGGKFRTKSEHHNGSTTTEQHDSPEELHEHQMSHFGVHGGDTEEPDTEEAEYDGDESDEGNALKSILG